VRLQTKNVLYSHENNGAGCCNHVIELDPL
jgi:hypothetical protein